MLLANNLEIALDLYRKKFNIFPLRGFNESIPNWFIEKHIQKYTRLEIKNLWCKTPWFQWIKYRGKPANKQQIEKWWGQKPGSNIGIITEKLVIIDADNFSTVNWCRQNAPTPIRVKTKRGYHFYFRKNTNLNIQTSNHGNKKLDIRGFDGIVTAPGSIHGSGFEYKWDIDNNFNFRNIYNIPIMTRIIWVKISDYLKGF